MGEFDSGDSREGLGCNSGCSLVLGAEGEETWVLHAVSFFFEAIKPSCLVELVIP
jgi:hypothetical protein